MTNDLEKSETKHSYYKGKIKTDRILSDHREYFGVSSRSVIGTTYAGYRCPDAHCPLKLTPMNCSFPTLPIQPHLRLFTTFHHIGRVHFYSQITSALWKMSLCGCSSFMDSGLHNMKVKPTITTNRETRKHSHLLLYLS